MRIANKGLRYTLETLQNAYDKRVVVFIKKVFLFHNQLGDIHDYDVWEVSLKKISRKHKFTRVDQKSLKELEGHIQRLHKSTYQQFMTDWKLAQKDNFFDRLKEYVQSFEK